MWATYQVLTLKHGGARGSKLAYCNKYAYVTRFFDTLLQPGKHGCYHFSYSQEVRRKKNLEFVVTVYQVFVVLIGRLPLFAQFHGKETQSKIGTWRWPFCCTPCPIHRPVKIVLKPRTNRKRKKWLRSVFHEVQFIIITPQSNSGQQETVERTRVALIPFPFTLHVWEELERTESANE